MYINIPIFSVSELNRLTSIKKSQVTIVTLREHMGIASMSSQRHLYCPVYYVLMQSGQETTSIQSCFHTALHTAVIVSPGGSSEVLDMAA